MSSTQFSSLLVRCVLHGDKIAPNYYEVAAFEALRGRVRSGDVAVGGSRRYRAFEHYLLPQRHFEQLVENSKLGSLLTVMRRRIWRRNSRKSLRS